MLTDPKETSHRQLSKYLSPQVYASIFAGKQSVEIASKRKKLTVFFCLRKGQREVPSLF